jgi:peptide-methionine (R)-S-oxide reductase
VIISKLLFSILFLTLSLAPACVKRDPVTQLKPSMKVLEKTTQRVFKTSQEWRRLLTPKQFHILREKGTERAFSGKYWNEKKTGVYHCAACGAPLFESDHKFKSGTGWPSFYRPLNSKSVTVKGDSSLGVRREEILCARCEGHLGHVFDDGPKPTGLRYCVNSESLSLRSVPTATPSDAGPPSRSQ